MKALAITLMLFFIGLTGLSFASQAGAVQESLWTTDTPVVARSNPLVGGISNDCPTYYQSIFIAELHATQDACVYGDESLRIGIFFQNGQQKLAVGFAYSADMHVLEGTCYYVCRYSADTDTLVTLQPINQYGRGVVVYKHVSMRIKQNLSESTSGYSFDTSHPEYEMKNDSGRYIWTPAIGISSNGMWAIVELRDNGIATLNLNTFVARQLTTSGYHYGMGMDPSMELAISDDGKSAAATGQNAGLRVFDIADGCGQSLVGDLSRQVTGYQCSYTDLGIGNSFPNFAEAHQPRFFGDGHQLEMVVDSWVTGMERVTFVTHGTPIAHQLKILTLGDSFASGEGETNDGYYEPGTNAVFDTCHVSMRAYAARIGQKLGMSDADVRNVACSGARITDIVGSNGEYEGQGKRLGASGLKLSDSEKQVAKEKAIDDFQPGRALQSNFIERYNPEIIMIGVGGNDAGLMGKLRTCAMPGTCEWAQGEGIKETAGEIKRLQETLGDLFARITSQAGNSRIFVVGYPNIINPDGSCDFITNVLLDHAERVFIQRSITYLNQVIQAAASRAGFTYIDIEHSFDGTALCNGASSTAMNGVRAGNDIAVIRALPMLKLIGAETFHPTPTGHELIADTVTTRFPGLLSAPTVVSPDTVPSDYWSDTGVDAGRSSYVADFAYQNGVPDRTIAIQVPPGTLQPNSGVTVEVHSDLTNLATFVADDEGGIQGVITLPASLEEGFHTLHLLGINRANDAVDLYQFLTTRKDGIASITNNEEGVSDPSIPSVSSVASLGAVQTNTDNSLPNAVAVLGVETTNGVQTRISKAIAAAIHPQRIRWHKSWALVAVSVCAAIALLTLCVVLVLKRWAKRGS